MNNRQIKKIIKKYGCWCPVDDNFKKHSAMKITYFSCGGWEKRIPWWKLRKFYPYNVFIKTGSAIRYII